MTPCVFQVQAAALRVVTASWPESDSTDSLLNVGHALREHLHNVELQEAGLRFLLRVQPITCASTLLTDLSTVYLLLIGLFGDCRLTKLWDLKMLVMYAYRCLDSLLPPCCVFLPCCVCLFRSTAFLFSVVQLLNVYSAGV